MERRVRKMVRNICFKSFMRQMLSVDRKEMSILAYITNWVIEQKSFFCCL